jgi:hypothetical protein
MPDQRALLVKYCNDHPVAACPGCSEALTFDRIGADVIAGKRDICPMCRADLTTAVLRHLAECTFMRAQERETRVPGREAATPNGTPDETREAQQESERLRGMGQEAIREVERLGRDYMPIPDGRPRPRP